MALGATPLDGEVKSLYSAPPSLQPMRQPETRRNPISEEFIVKRSGHIVIRSLPLSGQRAFVRAAFGRACAVVTMNERHPAESRRPTWSLGNEDHMHPGEGGA